MPTQRYAFGAEGQRAFLRAAADAQGEVLEPFFETSGWSYDPRYFSTLPSLRQRTQPTAFGGTELFGAFVVFIASCFAKKIFDEVYERTLKRPVAAQLDKFFNSVTVPPGKFVEYRDVVYLQDIDLTVVVRALAEREHTKATQAQLLQAHRVAHAYIELHGKRAPIHCHKIGAGLVTAEPELFNSLEEMRRSDRSRSPIGRFR